WFIGSTTDRLLRRSSVPLLIIGEARAKRSIPPNLRRILVTSDFSEGAKDALAYALSLGQEGRANLTLLHVIPREPIAVGPPLGPIVLDTQQSAEQIRQEMESRVPVEARD